MGQAIHYVRQLTDCSLKFQLKDVEMKGCQLLGLSYRQEGNALGALMRVVLSLQWNGAITLKNSNTKKAK